MPRAPCSEPQQNEFFFPRYLDIIRFRRKVQRVTVLNHRIGSAFTVRTSTIQRRTVNPEPSVLRVMTHRGFGHTHNFEAREQDSVLFPLVSGSRVPGFSVSHQSEQSPPQDLIANSWPYRRFERPTPSEGGGLIAFGLLKVTSPHVTYFCGDFTAFNVTSREIT